MAPNAAYPAASTGTPMPLSSWTDQQVIAQLNSGMKWTGSTITYSFPTLGASMYTVDEAHGFSAVTTQGRPQAELALRLWDDLISPDMVKSPPARHGRPPTSNSG